MKTYVLTIEYNEETEEIEYISEEIVGDETAFYYNNLDVSEYWDEETLELLANGYIFGES
tara:strand:- start:316 stop:495 length:180 start_codon:yes stop_codon:yes gene_type:complete